MDKRYLKIIADNFPYEQPKNIKNGIMICFMAAIMGFVMLLTNKDYAIYGFGVGVAAALGMITFSLLIYSDRKKKAKKFLADYEITKKLPEWPDSPGKDASPQVNN